MINFSGSYLPSKINLDSKVYQGRRILGRWISLLLGSILLGLYFPLFAQSPSASSPSYTEGCGSKESKELSNLYDHSKHHEHDKDHDHSKHHGHDKDHDHSKHHGHAGMMGGLPPEETIKRFDRNNDGALESRELRWIEGGDGKYARNLKKNFEQIDIDKNTRLNAEEITTWQQTRRAQTFAERTIKALDKDNDGFIGEAEAKQAKIPNMDKYFEAADQNRDAKLSRQELIIYANQWEAYHKNKMAQQQQKASLPMRKDEAFAQRLMKYLDKDTDGMITEEEAKQIKVPNWGQYFSEIDHNHDGKVTHEELVVYFPKWEERQKKMFLERWKDADADRDGLLNKEEMSVAKMPNYWAHHFEQVDTNRDGKLSLDEAQQARQNWIKSLCWDPPRR